MTHPGEEAAKARSLGLALLDASRIYEGFVIPSFEGRLRQRRFPPHRRAIIGLVGRQRRFLRAAYTLADAEQVLEAVGPLRSMLEARHRRAKATAIRTAARSTTAACASYTAGEAGSPRASWAAWSGPQMTSPRAPQHPSRPSLAASAEPTRHQLRGRCRR